MTVRPMPKSANTAIRAVLAVALASGVLGGCGVRGSLEAPAEAKASGQPTRPDAGAAAGSSTQEQKQPHRGFILDGLIR